MSNKTVDLEKINDELFEFYYAALVNYTRETKEKNEMFYMGGIEHIQTIYARINNISLEEAKNLLAAKVEKRIAHSQN